MDHGSAGIVIGLDIGRSRTGIARADVSLTLASPVAVLDTEPLATLGRRISASLGQVPAGPLVAGLPLDRNGEEGAASIYVREIAEYVSTQLELPVTYIDERFTTKEMLVRRGEAGIKKMRNQQEIDAWAAVSILQTYLDSSRNHRLEHD